MKSVIISGLVLLATACVSLAQVTPEEAQTRLQSKQAQRTATTQPSDQLAELRQIIATLRAENDTLKKEVAQLKADQAKPKVVAMASKKNAPADAIKALQRDVADFQEHLVGMTLDEASKKLSVVGIPHRALIQSSGVTKTYRLWASARFNEELLKWLVSVDNDGKIISFTLEE